MDVAHKWGADAVDEELIRLIERRARNGELDPDEQEEIWKASVRAYTARRREQIRAEWREYHQGQAERHSRTLEELVARHTTSTKRGEGALANE